MQFDALRRARNLRFGRTAMGNNLQLDDDVEAGTPDFRNADEIWTMQLDDAFRLRIPWNSGTSPPNWHTLGPDVCISRVVIINVLEDRVLSVC